MSSQQVTVKAYYNDLVENQPEIRRFTIDASPNNDVYQALETTIAQLNADYPQGQFTLQYVDEDNDRITFSSDSEIRSALSHIQPGGVIKIYVKPKAKKTEEKSEHATLHPGVTCDGCQGSIVGNRYKCTVCPDYDLCQACSDKKVHPDHNMIKIVRPWQHFGGHRRCGRGPFGGGRCGRGPFGGGRFWRQFMHQMPDGAAHFQMPGDLSNFLGQYKGKELAELIEAHLPEYLRTEKVTEMLNQFKTGEQADKPVEHNLLLENIGKFLQEILSPFGIDCDYFVDKQQQQQQQQQEKPTEQTETQETTANNNASTEPKPSAPPAGETASASASASAAPNVPSFGNLLDQLQTMFSPMFQQQQAAAAAAAATATTTAPKVDSHAEEEKKMAECIERMTAMGFVDSNGVLTELIKSKKGDLNQVLDALNPRNYQN
jgi:sequestosome 1